MNTRTFTDYWSFRLFGPIVSGIIIYLLILLINNSIEQALDIFISDEFFVCVVLAIIISESTRYLLLKLSHMELEYADIIKVLITVLAVLILTTSVVWLGLSFYFRFALGYQPNISELQPFIILYSGLGIALASVYLSHYFIQKVSSEMLAVERQLKEQSDANFLKLTRGVNPDLLFETLESLLTHIQDDQVDQADDMIDDFSLLYRYTLSKNSQEIIAVAEELKALDSLEKLINRLPYRQAQINIDQIGAESHIIPGSLLHIVEQIIKKTIVSNNKTLEIDLSSEKSHITISYTPHDKLNDMISYDDLKDLNLTYGLYTDQKVEILESDGRRYITLPVLNLTP